MAGPSALSANPRVAHEPERQAVAAADLVGIDVDLDHLLIRREPRHGESRADSQDHVCLIDVRAQGALGPERRAERQVAVVADGALPLGRLDDAGL